MNVIIAGGRGTNDMKNKAMKKDLILIEYKED